MSAVEYWKNKVQCHHEQSTRAQGESWSSEDFWRPFASAFRADPRRTDDPTVNRLARQVDLNSTILDVGGGAGRCWQPAKVGHFETREIRDRERAW